MVPVTGQIDGTVEALLGLPELPPDLIHTTVLLHLQDLLTGRITEDGL